MGMARHIGAFVQDHRLVRIRINNWPEHLVYFSYVLGDGYLESIGFAPFRRIPYDYPLGGTPDVPEDRKSDQSLIYTDGEPLEWEPEAFRRRFELALAQMEIPESEREPLFERYAAFNAALSGSATTDTDPTEFLDPGYMQRYETARYVLGLSGHGSLFGNLRVALNTANGKFYPAFNRDNEMSELDLSGGRIPELHINNLRPAFNLPYSLPLFRYAAASAPLRQRVYREIYRFIERVAAGNGRPAGGAGRPEAGCRRPFVGGSPFVGEARPAGAAPCGAASPPSPDLVAVALRDAAVPVRVNIRWIAGLEDAHRQRLEQRFGLSYGKRESAQTWEYRLADTSPARLADIVGNDAVEDTHGYNRGDFSLANQDRDLQRRQTRASHLYELVFTFSRPLLRLEVESIALTFVNTVTGQEVEARRVPAVEAAAGEALSPASAVAGRTDLFEDWAAAHAWLALRRTGPREITLARGVHDLQSDLVYPSGYDVVIEGGTDLRLGPGVVMLIHGGLTMAGSAGNPVTVRPIDAGQPFGTVAVLGDGSQRTTIRHLDLSGGSDAWVRGARFSGALNIHYQDDVEVSHASIHDNQGEGGLSIKYARGLLAHSVFSGNRVHQMDLDYFDGVVRDNRLTGAGAADRHSGGLDVTGSHLVATGNEFSGFIEAGVRVGESSDVLFAANTWRDNVLALAVTDLSTVYLHDDNEFSTNNLDVNAFLQKPHFGGGTLVLAEDADSAGLSVETDRLSRIANVSHTAIERLRPSEISPADVVTSLTDLSVASRR